MTAARTVIGPLTTTFTPPGYCSNVIVGCAYTCDYGWQAQDCLTDGYCQDGTSCWPPASKGAPKPTPAFDGWGFYSPGLDCPSGFVSACSATAGGSSDWNQEFSMTAGETAVGCCPSGYACNNEGAQTCKKYATKGDTIPVVTCNNGYSISSFLALPTKTTAIDQSATSSSALTEFTYSTMDLAAPMIEIRWRSLDRTESSSSSASSSTSAKTTKSSIPASSTPAQNTSSSGDSLSTGEKVAIGVVVPVAVIAIVIGIFFFWRKKIRSLKSKRDEWPRAESTAATSTSMEQPSEVRSYRKPEAFREYRPAPQELEGTEASRELDGSNPKPPQGR